MNDLYELQQSYYIDIQQVYCLIPIIGITNRGLLHVYTATRSQIQHYPGVHNEHHLIGSFVNDYEKIAKQQYISRLCFFSSFLRTLVTSAKLPTIYCKGISL